MVTRRQVIKTSAIGGTALLVPAAFLARRPAYAAPVPGGTLNPAAVPKYLVPLSAIGVFAGRTSGGTDFHDLAARQFNQQILPPGLPSTPVFGYGDVRDASTFRYPARSIEARVGRTTRVRWNNQLVTSGGDFRAHLLPLDQTLHWANPAGGVSGRDMRPEFTSTPGPYRGPVPLVTHLHGAHVTEDSDGYPEAWYLPAARDIPAGYATVGSYYDRYRAEAQARSGMAWSPGSAVFDYPNDQRATMLWYHGHELGMTRLNVYAGLVGAYLLRGGSADLPAGVLPGPAPQAGDPPGRRYYELPLVFQDKSFNTNGTLFFPASRGFFGDAPPDGPWMPTTDVSPLWNPEFFGNTMVVNGNTWPVLSVEPRRYRFRLVNACNARTLLLRIVSDPLAARPASAALPFWVIGADGGFLPAPVALSTLREGPAERFDIVVDFTGLPVGTTLYLVNEGPDSPFGGGQVGVDFDAADPGTTGQVMKFVVTALTSTDRSVPPAQLRLPSVPAPGNPGVTRTLSLNELDSGVFANAPTEGMLGGINPDGTATQLPWMAAVSETPRRGVPEIWELRNFTEDGHPVHLHQVQFQVLDRRPFGGTEAPTRFGAPVGPEPWETGFKDTAIALPGEVTRLVATFDIAGRYVWHCHILDHEDNEMMRPIQVLG